MSEQNAPPPSEESASDRAHRSPSPCEPSPAPSSRAPQYPSVQRLLDVIHDIYNGSHFSQDRYISEKLSKAQHAALEAALATEGHLALWWSDKLRYDWDEGLQTFTVRMPSPLHDTLAQRIQNDTLNKALEAAGADPPLLANYTKRLYPAGTSDARLPSIGQKSKMNPDASLRIQGRIHPPLVVEAAHSQDEAELTQKAERYIEGTDGKIKTIIALKAEYWPPACVAGEEARQASREAWYTIHRAILVKDEAGTILTIHTPDWTQFRDTQGTVLPGTLSLRLSDLLPTHNLDPDSDANRHLSFDHSDLVRMLEDAEEAQESGQADKDDSPSPPQHVCFKRTLSDDNLRPRVEQLATA